MGTTGAAQSRYRHEGCQGAKKSVRSETGAARLGTSYQSALGLGMRLPDSLGTDGWNTVRNE